MEPENTSAVTPSSVNSLGEELQQQVSALTDVVQTLLVRSNEDRRRLDLMSDYLGGVLTCVNEQKPLSSDNIQDAITQNQVERQNAAISKMVEMGLYKKVSSVNEKSVVLCQEFNLQGEEVNKRMTLRMAEVDEKFRPLLLGKKVDDTVVFAGAEGSGSSVVILDIFEENDDVAREFGKAASP